MFMSYATGVLVAGGGGAGLLESTARKGEDGDVEKKRMASWSVSREGSAMGPAACLVNHHGDRVALRSDSHQWSITRPPLFLLLLLTIVMQYPHGRIAQYAAIVNIKRKNGDADCVMTRITASEARRGMSEEGRFARRWSHVSVAAIVAAWRGAYQCH